MHCQVHSAISLRQDMFGTQVAMLLTQTSLNFFYDMTDDAYLQTLWDVWHFKDFMFLALRPNAVAIHRQERHSFEWIYYSKDKS